jgi:hypothetical protein
MKKLLVDGFTTKIACLTRSFRVLVYPSGVDVSTASLRYLSACLRTRRCERGTRWRRLPAGRQALLVLADAGRPLRAKDLCHAPDLGLEPKNIEGTRSKLKRLVALA